MLKRLPELTPSPSINPATQHARNHHLFPSPLYAPHGDFTALVNSCSTQTLGIIIDMKELTQAVMKHSSSTNTFVPTRQHHQIYDRLRSLPSTQGSDWTHESIRLAALMYTNAIFHRTTFFSAANIQHRDPLLGNRTFLCAVHSAVEHTGVAGCWDDLRGVFLWVCLVGGVAAWDSANTETGFVEPPMEWARKCFSIWAVRSVVGVGFEYADSMMEALKTGLKVRNFLDGRHP